MVSFLSLDHELPLQIPVGCISFTLHAAWYNYRQPNFAMETVVHNTIQYHINQWGFQDLKVEVLYHIRPYV